MTAQVPLEYDVAGESIWAEPGEIRAGFVYQVLCSSFCFKADMEIEGRNFGDVFAIITHAVCPRALCRSILGSLGSLLKFPLP